MDKRLFYYEKLGDRSDQYERHYAVWIRRNGGKEYIGVVKGAGKSWYYQPNGDQVDYGKEDKRNLASCCLLNLHISATHTAGK